MVEIWGKSADHQACVLQEGKRDTHIEAGNTETLGRCNKLGQPHHTISLPACLVTARITGQQSTIHYCTDKEKQTPVLWAGSSSSALPILSALARPQDLWGSKLTLSSCKNQTLVLVTNPRWIETRWHKVSLLSAHATYSTLFSLSVLGFLNKMNRTTCSNDFFSH